MFSGIIEEIGRVERAAMTAAGLELTIACKRVLEGTIIGDSISVDGVCLTVAGMTSTTFTAHIQPVTARLSTLSERRAGSPVNLERAVAAGQRLGGHYVQGHVDGVGRVVSKRGEGAALIVEITIPGDLARYVVERGFIAVDGASLTVMTLGQSNISVSLVYHSQQHITLPELPVGAPVNLETDVIAKYVERLVAPYQQHGGLSMEALERAGFS